MGSWGHTPFDNDAALDLLTKFLATKDAEAFLAKQVRAMGTKAKAINSSASGAETVIAAAALVAIAAGKPPREIPEELRSSVPFSWQASASLVEGAARAITLIAAYSDLPELMGAKTWALRLQELNDLHIRLGGAALPDRPKP